MNVKIPSGYKYSTMEKWCIEHISPRQYYLHNRIGGDGWDIAYSEQERCWKGTIDNEQMAFMYTLKFGT